MSEANGDISSNLLTLVSSGVKRFARPTPFAPSQPGRVIGETSRNREAGELSERYTETGRRRRRLYPRIRKELLTAAAATHVDGSGTTVKPEATRETSSR